MDERLTKKERKEQRKLERLENMESAKKLNKKTIVISLVVLLFLGFFAWMIVATKQNKPQKTVKFSSSGQKIGSSSAKLTLVEFGDFQCPACKSYEPSLKQVKEKYKNEVMFVFKHFPLKSVHPNALPAAIAAEAAGKQNKFWPYHELLYQKQEEWSSIPNVMEKFVDYASVLDLDIDKFQKDIKDKNIEKKINAELDEGIKSGVNSTPSFFLNGKFIEVNNTLDSFSAVIDKALK